MTRYVALTALFVAGLVAAGCSSSATEASADRTATAAAKPPVHDGRAIQIEANDKMKFSLTEITARPGEKLTLTLTNRGTTPKFSMGHNVVLLTGGTDPDGFALLAMEAATTEYLPAAMKSRVIAATKLLGPGESDTVTFTAPSAPGSYVFLCSFPGHFQVGMRGVLIVQ